jgi:DNA-binding transcriptional LysR family regulator
MDAKGLRRFEIAGVQMIPVAAPAHPLAAASEAAAPWPREMTFSLSYRTNPQARARISVWSASDTWRVGELMAKHKLLLGGLGCGGMPEPMVRADIEARHLVRLNLRDWRGGEYLIRSYTGPMRPRVPQDGG